MRALVYDPYVDTMGGGERYVLTFALALVKAGYSVDLAWKDSLVVTEAARRFNLDLSAIKIDPAAYHDLSLSAGLLARYRRTKNYDLVFWVSDGSLPYLFGRKNYLHFQAPFKKIGGHPINNFIKTVQVDKLIFNSGFTSSVVKKQLPFVSSVVLYPPIDTENFKSGKKENIILSVARFDSPSHAKRQDVLIEAFKKLHQQQKDYQLILAGAVKGEGGEDYLASLKQVAGKLPIKFIPNPDFNELKKLYAKAKIFWHAAGYDIDENKEPEKVEHFGITTVEAMAAGCVPVVVDKGGQREIITPGTGYLCDSVEKMVETTVDLLNSPVDLDRISRQA
ncbi:MAG: glycosyltransferase family 4 protein, partial [Microgenomates group bacterium]